MPEGATGLEAEAMAALTPARPITKLSALPHQRNK
jgi:hypothetical protein